MDAVQNRGSPVWRKFQLAITTLVVGTLAGCSTSGSVPGALPSRVTANHVSAAFGPDGRLWRVLAGERYVYVDHSADLGRSFSPAMVVNRVAQRIRANSQDRPHIAIDRSGVVYVTYSADFYFPWTPYVTVSRDGEHFSPPRPVSDHAQQAKHYLVDLVADPAGGAKLFWHDERDHAAERSGAALYFTSVRPDGTSEPDRRIGAGQCECCRIAADFALNGTAVLFTRQIYPGQIRDHGFWAPGANGRWRSWRSTDDDWQVEACPEHGPALAIAPDGRYHVAWFTQGRRRKGLFYAYSEDGGRQLSRPIPFGNPAALAGHPALAAVGDRVVLVWREFNGKETQIVGAWSNQHGSEWSAPVVLATTAMQADEPLLLRHETKVYLSWNTRAEGYRLIPLP